MKKLLSLLAMFIVAPAFAIDVTFGSTVSTSCTLSVNQGGAMVVDALSPGAMSTGLSGGSPASVGVTFIGTPTLSVSLPSAFATSPTINFTPTFSGTASSTLLGSLSFSNGTATGSYSSGSSDTLTLNLSASTGSATAFPTGTYTAVVTVTCS